MVERLTLGPASVSELAEPLAMSPGGETHSRIPGARTVNRPPVVGVPPGSAAAVRPRGPA